MSKPSYTLADCPMPDDRTGLEGIEFLGVLVGKGEFNGVVIGFRKFELLEENSGQDRINVEYEIVAIPEALLEHKDDIQSGVGKTYKKLSKEINMVSSVILGEVVNEEKQKLNDRPESTD